MIIWTRRAKRSEIRGTRIQSLVGLLSGVLAGGALILLGLPQDAWAPTNLLDAARVFLCVVALSGLALLFEAILVAVTKTVDSHEGERVRLEDFYDDTRAEWPVWCGWPTPSAFALLAAVVLLLGLLLRLVLTLYSLAARFLTTGGMWWKIPIVAVALGLLAAFFLIRRLSPAWRARMLSVFRKQEETVGTGSASQPRVARSEPSSADEWLSLLSSRSTPVRDRVTIAYTHQYKYCESVKNRLKKLLIEDSDLRRAIQARYEAEREAHEDRLPGPVDYVAMEAHHEQARMELLRDPAEYSWSDLRMLAKSALATVKGLSASMLSSYGSAWLPNDS